MKIIPAIDLMDGKVVRLYKGNPENKTIYSNNPIEIAKKWESFGWKVLEVDGHDHKKLFKIFNHQSFNKPLCIICHTIKGKGVKFMENNNLWHYRTARGKEFLEAQIQIEKKI